MPGRATGVDCFAPVIDLTAQGVAPKANATYVNTYGTGDYTTLAAALAAASSGDEIICQGINEALNTTVPDGVRVRGDHFAQETIISSADGVSPALTMAGAGTLRELTVVTPNTSGVPAIDCTGLAAGKLVVLFNVAVQGGGSGIGLKGAGSGVVAAIQGFYHNGGTLEQLCLHTSGTMLGCGWITNAGVAGDVLKVTGGTARLSVMQSQDSDLYSCTDYLEISGGRLIVSDLELPDNGKECATNAIHISGDGIDLEVTGPALHGSTWDVLVDAGLVGTGTRAHVLNEADFSKYSYPAGYRDVADTRGNFGSQTGWATYVDTTHTVGSPQVLSAGTRTQWTNDAGTKNETYRPGVTPMWSSNKITPSRIGEAYTLRVDFIINPAATNGLCTVEVDIGSDPFGASSVPILNDTFSLVKGAIAQSISRTYTIFCLDTFFANGGAVAITCDKAADVYDKRITLVRIH
jgi:hypothetical protein